ncbi:MAG: ABC transporter substrate-binding protein [Acetobacteraceae bacterium]
MTAICDKLFDFDAKLNIVPVLASGYEWTDPTHLLIHVRPNVTFQDGEKLDAAAVVYTLQRDLTAPGSFRQSEIGAMDHAEVADPMTVRVVMKQPFSPFVAALTDRAGMMVAPKAAEAAGKNFGLHPVCAGPFSFVDRVAQDHITLERYPGYWAADGSISTASPTRSSPTAASAAPTSRPARWTSPKSPRSTWIRWRITRSSASSPCPASAMAA